MPARRSSCPRREICNRRSRASCRQSRHSLKRSPIPTRTCARWESPSRPRPADPARWPAGRDPFRWSPPTRKSAAFAPTAAAHVPTAGYAVELAEGEKRALEVAAGGEIEAAIVVPGSGLASLAQALRDKIPRTIVLGEPADAHVRRGLLGGADEFVLQNL